MADYEINPDERLFVPDGSVVLQIVKLRNGRWNSSGKN